MKHSNESLQNNNMNIYEDDIIYNKKYDDVDDASSTPLPTMLMDANKHKDENEYEIDDESATPIPTSRQLEHRDIMEITERKYESNDGNEPSHKQNMSFIIDKFMKNKKKFKLYSLDCLNLINFGSNILMINEKQYFHVMVNGKKYKFYVDIKENKAGNVMISCNNYGQDGVELKLNSSLMVCINSMDKGQNVIYNLFHICLLSLKNKVIMVNDMQLKNKYYNNVISFHRDQFMNTFLEFMNSDKNDDNLKKNEFGKYVKIMNDTMRFIPGYGYYWLTD